MIQGVRWEDGDEAGGQGLCGACCEEKRAEWEEEIRVVWEKVDGWI